MESDNSSFEAPKSPPVDMSPAATQRTPPIEPKKTPETSPDKGAVASEPATPRSDKIEPEKASFATTMPSTAYSAGSEVGSVVKDPNLDDDTGNDNDLSDPPESISGMSDVAMNEGSQDEIVVGSANNDGTPKTEGLPAVVDREDSNIMDVDREEEEMTEAPPPGYPKRKRSYAFGDLMEDKMIKSVVPDDTDEEASPAPGPAPAMRIGKTPRTTHGLASVKGVTIGYWRESKAPIGDKHIVKGFIDSRDRLRTRVQPCNRHGKVVTDLYPLNPGPGGSWVTFEKIVFDDHLVHLDQTQVKEYVKIRSEMDDPEGEIGPNSAAVQQAIARCKARGAQVEGAQPPQIAYGVDIPDHALHRPEKRRRTGGANSANATPVSKSANTPSHPPVADLHGTRPTKILLGFWKGSAEPDDKDKHAVFGILGNNDMFRVKVGRETRDGRPLQSNFPSGAGALWLSFDEYQIEDYLEGLSRVELKEYCRVRQYQMDHGEQPEDKDQNRKIAIDEARHRVASGFTKPEPREQPLPSNTNGGLGEGPYPDNYLKRETPTHETRQAHARRSLPTLVPNQARQSTQPPEFRAANRGVAVESRTNNLAVNAVARVEARQTKNDQREAAYMARQSTEGEVDGEADGQASFQDNVSRLNRVWAAQEAHRMRANKEDAKIYMGIKYERKQTGPFEGKLVSQGTIISIDGEDYVEYRVLTKPTFF